MIGTEQQGARLYVTGDSFSIKDQLKAAGCHWDADRRQWWIGTAKAAAVLVIVEVARNAPAVPAIPPDLSKSPVYGKAEYKGRSYYIIGKSREGDRLHLTVLAGDMEFWADVEACVRTKTYQPRKSGYGRYAREEYQTLGAIRRFIKRQGDPATRRGQCTECGAWGPSGQPCSECGGEGSYM